MTTPARHQGRIDTPESPKRGLHGLLAALLCLAALPATATAAIETDALPGVWSAHGRYYERDIDEMISARFEIANDLTLTGAIGSATWRPTRPTVTGAAIHYRVPLMSAASTHPRLHDKDWLELIITTVDQAHFEADFHLKSWRGFDLSMHPGELQARRVASDRADDGMAWITYYYLHPQPEQAIPALTRLSDAYAEAGRSLASEAERGALRSFYATLLASDDRLVDELERERTRLPVDARVFVEAALARCNASACRRARNGVPALPPEASSPRALDESWGQFMANGAREPVQAVIAALPLIETGDDVEQRLIEGAARWSLRSQALQHPFVLAYCQDAARGADEPNRHLLRALIDDVRRDFNDAAAP